jgi:hypothetical protein
MLPAVDDFSTIGMSLSPDGGRLRVRNAGALVAIVDTSTFAVRAPGERAAEPVSDEPKPAAAGFPWLWLVLPLAAAAGGVLVIRARPAYFQK